MTPPFTPLEAEAASLGRAQSGGVARLALDLVTLTKPRLTMTVVTTAMGGWFAAASRPSGSSTLAVLLGTLMVVGGANTLNMYLERDSDRFMVRTSNRPLPSGRMAPWVALSYGAFLSLASLPILYFFATPMAALLAAIANVLYVFVYTPMKPRSWLSVWAGAVPGAIPPLLGWAASTGQIDWAGASLFGILFFWQVPHFHAIALFRTEDYTRAGLVVLPAIAGARTTQIHIAVGTLALVASTFVPYLLGMTSRTYLVAVTVMGVAFTWLAMQGLRANVERGWASRYFRMSIPFLVFTFLALLFTRV